MSAQPKPTWATSDEKYAFFRRRDHSNLDAMQNLVVSRIAQEKGIEMPPNVRHLISALQGAHGGGLVPYEEFERDYLTIGRQLQFTGTEDAIRARVRRWLDDLDEWQFNVGYQLFVIVKGGKVLGYREDGSPHPAKNQIH